MFLKCDLNCISFENLAGLFFSWVQRPGEACRFEIWRPGENYFMNGDAERWGMKPRSSCQCLFTNTQLHGMPTKPQFGISDVAGEPHVWACRKHSLPSLVLSTGHSPHAFSHLERVRICPTHPQFVVGVFQVPFTQRVQPSPVPALL